MTRFIDAIKLTDSGSKDLGLVVRGILESMTSEQLERVNGAIEAELEAHRDRMNADGYLIPIMLGCVCLGYFSISVYESTNRQETIKHWFYGILFAGAIIICSIGMANAGIQF